MKSISPTPRRRWQAVRTTGKIVFGRVLAVALVAALGLGLAVARLWPDLPPLDKVTHYEPQQPLIVYTADGVQIGVFGEERRAFTRIQDVPQLMKQAIMAAEDEPLC